MASINANLTEHKKSSHAEVRLPCELCDFVAKSADDYKKHDENEHDSPKNVNKNDNAKKSYADKVKHNQNQNKKKENTAGVKIPCDLCNFTSTSADDFIKHIESKHQKTNVYPCDRCDYEGKSEEQFKRHLDSVHNLNTRGFSTVSHAKNSNKLCINWNRGHCTHQNCKFVHNEIPPCMFKERCARTECKFWHEPQTGKFPFLDLRRSNPNVWPRGEFRAFQNY